MVKNERDFLIYDLTFLHCLAQIVVHDVSFAPYKCVSFEAMTLDSRKAMESGSDFMSKRCYMYQCTISIFNCKKWCWLFKGLTGSF